MFDHYSDSLLTQTGHLSIKNPIEVEDAYKLINEGKITSLSIKINSPSLDDSKIIKTNLMGPDTRGCRSTTIWYGYRVVESTKLTELICQNNKKSWEKYERNHISSSFSGKYVLHHNYHRKQDVDYDEVGYFSDDVYSEDEEYFSDEQNDEYDEEYFSEEEGDPRDLPGNFDGEEYASSDEN